MVMTDFFASEVVHSGGGDGGGDDDGTGVGRVAVTLTEEQARQSTNHLLLVRSLSANLLGDDGLRCLCLPKVPISGSLK